MVDDDDPIYGMYPLANSQLDPEKIYFLVDTHLPTPMTTRVRVNFLEGNDDIMMLKS
jgi:hypothetical protein